MKLKKEIEKVANEPVVLEKKKKLKGEKKSKKTLSTGKRLGITILKFKHQLFKMKMELMEFHLQDYRKEKRVMPFGNTFVVNKFRNLFDQFIKELQRESLIVKDIPKQLPDWSKRQNSRLAGKPITTAARRHERNVGLLEAKMKKEERDLRKRAERKPPNGEELKKNKGKRGDKQRNWTFNHSNWTLFSLRWA